METTTARRERVEQAVANERLENLVVSEESLRIADNYVVGTASASQVAAEIRERYGITVK
ncbi:MAG: antitoxin VbhA family protein [Propionibacteriaceae bacterium]|jgi:predicted methyltransferase MtxX (methanogen marker protein 4)|nr:antitoxin VbhA family protein [Propionibacteriaceae bacterium]